MLYTELPLAARVRWGCMGTGRHTCAPETRMAAETYAQLQQHVAIVP
jgi:hypothetical protein